MHARAHTRVYRTCTHVHAHTHTHTHTHTHQVLQALRDLGAVCARGNNDDAALAAYAAWQRGEEPLEKFDFVRGLAADDVEQLLRLPFSVSMPEYGVVVVHAGGAAGARAVLGG